MAQESELQKLERFVEKLLGKFSALKAQNSKLQMELKNRENEIEQLRGNISSNDTERTEISQRVTKIVEQIEEWEVSLDEMDQEVIYQEDQSDDGKTVDEENRVQHNLFSMSGSEEEKAQ